jgi:hypothetical protein
MMDPPFVMFDCWPGTFAIDRVRQYIRVSKIGRNDKLSSRVSAIAALSTLE